MLGCAETGVENPRLYRSPQCIPVNDAEYRRTLRLGLYGEARKASLRRRTGKCDRRGPAAFEKRRISVILGRIFFRPFLCYATKKWTRHSREAAGEIDF